MKNTIKITLSCFALALVLRVAFNNLSAQTSFRYYPATFLINSELPYDCVEIEAVQAGEVRWFTDKPTKKPTDLPASYVLVRVFAHVSPEQLAFVGWFWLDAAVVNALHDPQSQTQL